MKALGIALAFFIPIMAVFWKFSATGSMGWNIAFSVMALPCLYFVIAWQMNK